MKKKLIILLTLLLTITVIGCGDKNSDSNNGNDDTQDESSSELKLKDGNTPATLAYNDFATRMNEGTYTDTDTMATNLMDSESIEFAPMTMPVQPGYLNGFTEEITGFKSGTMFGPMIGSIPYVGYIFELEDGQDADAFVKNLMDKSDLAWNVCTQADEKIAQSSGNVVFFIMAPKSFED